MSNSENALKRAIEKHTKLESQTYGYEPSYNNTPMGYMSSSIGGGGGNSNSGSTYETNHINTNTRIYFTGRSCG